MSPTGFPGGPQAQGNEILINQEISLYRLPPCVYPTAGRQYAMFGPQRWNFSL